MDTHPAPAVTPDDVAQLQDIATELTHTGYPAGVLIAKLLRERGEFRVAARKLYLELPASALAGQDASELYELLAPWPTCELKAS